MFFLFIIFNIQFYIINTGNVHLKKKYNKN